jgi:hypothetical protein
VEQDLEKIVAKSYVIEKKREGWQYRVRFVGYGAGADEWYWEEDLAETAPKEMEEFNERWERGEVGVEPDPPKSERAKKGKKKGGKKKKAGAATILCANVGMSGSGFRRKVTAE